MLQGMGLKTGVNLDKLVDTSQFIYQHLNRLNGSKVALALSAKKAKL
jgi:hydroxymethylglutaryl-CoA lyase